MTLAITKKQQAVLDYIKAHIEECGFPPTRQEIADALGFKSPNSAEEHLQAMQRKGIIHIHRGTVRGITIPGTSSEPDPKEMAQALRVIATWAQFDIADKRRRVLAPADVLALCEKALKVEAGRAT